MKELWKHKENKWMLEAYWIMRFKIFTLRNMANKRLNSASAPANKWIAELPEKRKKIKAQVQLRTEILESQKRVNYQNEFDRLQGAKRLNALHPKAKSRMNDLQNMARKSLKGDTHAIYKNQFNLFHNI